jgi:hypothetical protein
MIDPTLARGVLLPASMGQPAAKKARGGGEGLVPTIREFLPWHVIEKKMAARAQGRIHDDGAPDSGVYASGEHAAAVIAANQNGDALPPDDRGEPLVPTDSGGLTYQVYTVKDLEARGLAADLSVNSTRMSMVLMAAKPNPWADVARATLNVFRLAKTWLFTPSPKPPVALAFRAPIVALGYELRQAIKTVEWKKVSLYAGISVGVFLVLLFAVVTAADLTDDLKPSRVSNTQTGDSYTNAIVAAAHPSAAPVAKSAPPANANANGDGLEVSSEPTPPPPVVKAATPKKKGGGKKKTKNGEVFSP